MRTEGTFPAQAFCRLLYIYAPVLTSRSSLTDGPEMATKVPATKVVLLALVIFVQRASAEVDQHQFDRTSVHPHADYINSWAVKITGGESATEREANRYGFYNLGLVSAVSEASFSLFPAGCRVF